MAIVLRDNIILISFMSWERFSPLFTSDWNFKLKLEHWRWTGNWDYIFRENNKDLNMIPLGNYYVLGLLYIDL